MLGLKVHDSNAHSLLDSGAKVPKAKVEEAFRECLHEVSSGRRHRMGTAIPCDDFAEMEACREIHFLPDAIGRRNKNFSHGCDTEPHGKRHTSLRIFS
jgi:hypothetical protein